MFCTNFPQILQSVRPRDTDLLIVDDLFGFIKQKIYMCNNLWLTEMAEICELLLL